MDNLGMGGGGVGRNPRAPHLSIEMPFGSGNLGGRIVLLVIFQVLPLPFMKDA